MDGLLTATIPVLASLDLDVSVAFYVKSLGFEERLMVPGKYAIVSREGCEIHFWLCTDPYLARNTSCYIRTPNVDALYRDFCLRGLLAAPPTDRAWQMRELDVIDPYGNLLRFGQSMAT